MRFRVLCVFLLALCACGGTQETDDGPQPDPGPSGFVDPEPEMVEPEPEPGLGCVETPASTPETGFFEDISDASGIRAGNYDPKPAQPIPINDHSRLGFVDLNGDGLDDIVAHSLFPNPQAGIPFTHVTFINNGDGTFTDATETSGLKDIQAGFFAYGDVDNDGDQDVFAGLDVPLTGQTSAIYLNDGQGVFSRKIGAGVEGLAAIAGNAVFFDYNNDAVLDLFVGMGQTSFAGTDALFFGRGDGTFSDRSMLLGGNRRVPSNGSVACDYDNDGDQDIFVSTYSVSTELGANFLYEFNEGRFDDVAVARGFASQATGNYFLASTGNGKDPEPGKGPGEHVGSNGFGLDCGDINNDGLADIYLTTISHPVNSDYLRKWSDPSQLLVNLGPGADHAFENRYLELNLPFNEGDIDGAMVDFDNDGRLDLSVSRDNKYERNYNELDQDQKAWFGLMWQTPDGTFRSLGRNSGINAVDAVNSASLVTCEDDSVCPEGEACLADRCRIPCEESTQCPTDQEICHSGGFCRLLVTMKKAQNHAWADIDHDGDLDLLVGGRDAGGGRPNFLFRNGIGHQNRWMAVKVEGDGQKVNRDGIGAKVILKNDDTTIVREVRSSRGTYNSTDTRHLHFGLQAVGCDYTISVVWPDGTEVELPRDAFSEGAFHTLSYPDTVSVLD